MYRKILAICLALIITLCAAGAPAAWAESEGWTILLYLCGSDLESDGGYATGDLIEILEAEYSDNVHVLIQTGGAGSWDNDVVDPDAIERYEKTEDMLHFVEALPSADMGDPSTLEDFIEWGLENYPAEHTGLILWNHGSGSISGVCFDELYGKNSLSVRDISDALSGAGAKFDFVGFDACLMSTFETAYMLAPYSDYMYASEETEPGTGWDYTTILTYLARNPGADGAQLGQIQVESYFDICLQSYYDPSITFSITDLSGIQALADALNDVSRELHDSDEFAPVVRSIMKADNFGGNSRSEGYTNMVDLADLLRQVSGYAPSAQKALSALSDAVIYNKTESLHKDAGGLSIYYPLCVKGTRELSIFRDICPSTYYLALVDKAAEGADLSAGQSSASVTGAYIPIGHSESLEVEDIYLDEDGIYTVELNSMDEFAYASCSVFMDNEDGSLIYLGEDDDVIMYYDSCIIQDNFDGSWLYFNGNLLPIELVSANDSVSLYACSVFLNDEETNLQIMYDWEEGTYSVLGTWDGIDPDTGMAARSAEPLNEGDIINIIYYYVDEDDNWDSFCSDDIIVDGDFDIDYYLLYEGDYYYAINVYDIYGNCYQLDYTVFYVDEDGGVSFYED